MKKKNLALSDLTDLCVIRAPFGALGIASEMTDSSLMISRIIYLPKGSKLIKPKNDLVRFSIDQLEAYFTNPDSVFTLPIKSAGTIYQQKVWSSVCEIQVGKTMTYGNLAKKIRSGARAVGTACGANPYPLIIPCHRVIAAHGIGGFMQHAGPNFYTDVKRWLLQHESRS